MCACELSFVCSRCRGTWLAVDYPDDEPETLWEQQDREASRGNQPAEFIGVAR